LRRFPQIDIELGQASYPRFEYVQILGEEQREHICNRNLLSMPCRQGVRHASPTGRNGQGEIPKTEGSCGDRDLRAVALVYQLYLLFLIVHSLRHA